MDQTLRISIKTCQKEDIHLTLTRQKLESPNEPKIKELYLFPFELSPNRKANLMIGLTHKECVVTMLNAKFSLTDSLSGIKMISKILEHPNNKIKILNLSNTWIGTTGFIHLCHAFKSNYCQVQILNIQNNQLTVDSYVLLATVLKTNFTLFKVIPSVINEFSVTHICSLLDINTYCERNKNIQNILTLAGNVKRIFSKSAFVKFPKDLCKTLKCFLY